MKGIRFLYETTYKSKYYLALQYVKNEEMARDVLQEAYIRAFTKLDMLAEPEAFPGWLGKIVANTAKNVLVKKNPMLFSEMGAEDEGEDFEYRIEDDSIESQPELSYTRQETQELVHQMIDSLSEEQRMCILMFHIEGVPISEIASTLGCSENTVKSRLNYGRKNLKRKAEEYRKRDTSCTMWLRCRCSFICCVRRKDILWQTEAWLPRESVSMRSSGRSRRQDPAELAAPVRWRRIPLEHSRKLVCSHRRARSRVPVCSPPWALRRQP